MLAGREVMVKKLSDFKERHKAKQSESIAILLARAAEEGDQEAISLLACCRCLGNAGLKTNRACQQSGSLAMFSAASHRAFAVTRLPDKRECKSSRRGKREISEQ
jgi:hypothetical protein